MFIGSSRSQLLGCPLTLCFFNLASFAMPGNAIQHTIYLGLVSVSWQLSELDAGHIYFIPLEDNACQVLEYYPEPWNEWFNTGNIQTGRGDHAVLTIGPHHLPCMSGESQIIYKFLDAIASRVLTPVSRFLTYLPIYLPTHPCVSFSI